MEATQVPLFWILSGNHGALCAASFSEISLPWLSGPTVTARRLQRPMTDVWLFSAQTWALPQTQNCTSTLSTCVLSS